MTSTSSVNANCVLRRNLKTQPYGRCSVCTLKLSGCHAWQASLLSFGILFLALASTVAPPGWAGRALALGIVALVVAEGRSNHRRTDELIDNERALRESNARLTQAVAGATGELKDANRALATSNLELIETDRLRDAFIANLAHDLRTPLTAVRGAADNLLDGIAGPLLPEQREYVGIVRDHSTRLGNALAELLQAARLRAGQVEMNPESLELRPLVEEVARGLEPLAREKKVRLSLRGGDAKTTGDREKLRRVVENLVSNAIKFTGADGEVVVDVISTAEGSEIAVRDTGSGIPSAEIPRLFERFYRGSSPQSGTGLGLSIASNLVRLHGGDIRVSSEVGRGSEFRVRLPPSDAIRSARLPILGAA